MFIINLEYLNQNTIKFYETVAYRKSRQWQFVLVCRRFMLANIVQVYFDYRRRHFYNIFLQYAYII